MGKKIFHTTPDDDIKAGRIVDVYFPRGVEILKRKKLDRPVKGEVRASKLPDGWGWAILAGIEELAHLLEGLPIDVYSLPEGTLFHSEEPTVMMEGNYIDFGVYETSLLGLLCQASGVATRAARCKLAAAGRPVYSFGARRMHPAITPMIERNAFIGGCDGVAVSESAKLIGEKPIGTMAHALILTMGEEKQVFQAFDEVIDPAIKRVALVDTFEDEKFGALKAAEALGSKLFAVRLDTPKSRRGDFVKIMQEVRWELDLRGYKDIKIFVSGGVDEETIAEYNTYADAYGVGTAISNAPVIDFSFDLVEVAGRPVAKRGKMSGAKQVMRCVRCLSTKVVPADKGEERCSCGGKKEALLKPLIKQGKIVYTLPSPQEIRKYVLNQLAHLSLNL